MDEWKLLRWIQDRVPRAGDDCAVVPFGDTHLVLTLDMLHASSDFPTGTDPFTIGWRSIAVTLSDIAAMGARPLGVLLGLSAPSLTRSMLEPLLEGAQACCEGAGAELVGGDLDTSEELFTVSSAAGETVRPVLRSGARAGELLCVTGPLGRTAHALALGDRGQLDKMRTLLRFVPRVAEGLRLAAVATSMIDISDGLAHSVHLLAEASGVGFTVLEDTIPWVEGLAAPAPDFGEDYELLFTLPADAFHVGLGTVIGHAEPSELRWRGPSGDRPLLDRGYNRTPESGRSAPHKGGVR